MSPRQCMINLMANVICVSNDYDGDRLNDSVVWDQFMHEVLANMETCPDLEMRQILETVDREDFQQWIDDPHFWEELNQEVERRGQVLMTVLPSEHQGTC